MTEKATTRKRRVEEAALDEDDLLLQGESPTKKSKAVEDEEYLDEDALLGSSDKEENLHETGLTDEQNYDLEEEEVGLEEDVYGEEGAGLLDENAVEEFGEGGEEYAKEGYIEEGACAEGHTCEGKEGYIERGEGKEYVEGGGEGEEYAEGAEEYVEGGEAEGWNEGEGTEDEWHEEEGREETWYEEEGTHEHDVLIINCQDDSLFDDFNQSFVSQPICSNQLTTPKSEKPKPSPPRVDETSLEEEDSENHREQTKNDKRNTVETSDCEEDKEDEEGRGARTRDLPHTLAKKAHKKYKPIRNIRTDYHKLKEREAKDKSSSGASKPKKLKRDARLQLFYSGTKKPFSSQVLGSASGTSQPTKPAMSEINAWTQWMAIVHHNIPKHLWPQYQTETLALIRKYVVPPQPTQPI